MPAICLLCEGPLWSPANVEAFASPTCSLSSVPQQGDVGSQCHQGCILKITSLLRWPKYRILSSLGLLVESKTPSWPITQRTRDQLSATCAGHAIARCSIDLPLPYEIRQRIGEFAHPSATTMACILKISAWTMASSRTSPRPPCRILAMDTSDFDVVMREGFYRRYVADVRESTSSTTSRPKGDLIFCRDEIACVAFGRDVPRHHPKRLWYGKVKPLCQDELLVFYKVLAARGTKFDYAAI